MSVGKVSDASWDSDVLKADGPVVGKKHTIASHGELEVGA